MMPGKGRYPSEEKDPKQEAIRRRLMARRGGMKASPVGGAAKARYTPDPPRANPPKQQQRYTPSAPNPKQRYTPNPPSSEEEAVRRRKRVGY